MSFPGYTRPRDHGERLAQLDQLLAGWRDYIQKAPEDGNSLAGDDHLFPMLPPSQLAWFGIVSAVDHLDIFMALVRSGTSHPLAHNTRTTPSPAPGVLSGAHALWLLNGPDRVERQKRGLCLAHEEFFREHQAVRDIAAIQNSDPVRGLTAMKDYLDARVEWMDRALAAGATIGTTSKEVKTLNETGLLDTVAHRLVEHDPENVELISAVRIVWRTYSGVAHGLRWPVRYRTKYGEPIPGSRPGTVEGLVTNSIGDLDMEDVPS